MEPSRSIPSLHTPEGNLILVRHSLPAKDASRPAASWSLSPLGVTKARELAAKLKPYEPEMIYHSGEQKAYHTAQIIAQHTRSPLNLVNSLHEHLRKSVPFMTRKAFKARVAAFFHYPNRLIFGEETARQALIRFSRGMEAILTSHRGKNICVVSHGTVMTLWVASIFNLNKSNFWQSLTLPSALIIPRPINPTQKFSLIKITESGIKTI